MSWLNIFKRANTIVQAKANTGIDTLENPVEMTQQAVRDWKDKLQKAVSAEVDLKALVIEKKSNAAKAKSAAAEWETKANKILDRVGVGEGQITQEKADQLAGEALKKQSEYIAQATEFSKSADAQQKSLDVLDAKIKDLRTAIQETEEHMTELQSRQKTAEASNTINKELSNLGGIDNTKALIDRMEAKVSHIENESEAYVELGHANQTTADEINEVLKDHTPDVSASLAALKAKRAK